jgi:nucleoid-associated protein YgaU
MGLLSFIKDAGAKLFHSGDSAEQKAAAIDTHIRSFQLENAPVTCTVNSDTATATLEGTVSSFVLKQKLLTIAGNIAGVSQVEDKLLVDAPAPEASAEHFHDVVSGDTLSKIAKEAYGDAMKYPVIFEANKPMLSDPDKIYVGQKLVIPVLEA